MPRDNEFYMGKEEYFYPVKINFLFKFFVSVILLLIFCMIRDIGPAVEES